MKRQSLQSATACDDQSADWRVWSWSLVAVVGLTASGCQSWNPMGEGFGGPMKEFGSGMRKEADGGPGLGLSNKSREIERNLGYK